MSFERSRLLAALRSARIPPNGLSSEWQSNYLVLIEPLSRVISFAPESAQYGSRELFEAWAKSLRQSETAADAILRHLHGRAHKTWHAGTAILEAIIPVRVFLVSAARFLVFPKGIKRKGGTGVGPTKNGRRATAQSLRMGAADKLSAFPEVAMGLVDELAAAVLHDCAKQRETSPSDQKSKSKLLRKTRMRGRPRLSEAERMKRVKEYTNFKASNLTQRQYLKNRGLFPGLTESEALHYLELCRKTWKASCGK